MAKEMYIGVGGKARSVKQIYVGVGGVARKVKKAYIGVNGVARLMYQAGTPIGNYAVGSVVKLKESGAWVDYLIVHQGLPPDLYDASCNGTWVLRKDVAENRQLNSTNMNKYANSTMHSYLNSTYLARFEASVQSAIKQVKIPYCAGKASSTVYSGDSGLSTKVFLISGMEVGYSNSDGAFPIDGRKLDYFIAGKVTSANNKRIAYLGSGVNDWWLRSSDIYLESGTWSIKVDGSSGGFNEPYAHGVRPAFVLPASLGVEDGGYVTG